MTPEMIELARSQTVDFVRTLEREHGREHATGAYSTCPLCAIARKAAA